MSKVVAIIGSPRKNGNVGSIVSEILRGAADSGAQTKVYHLNDMNIKGCQSCLYCREHPACCVKDDMQAIYEDLKDADSIIIGSPIYIWQVSGQAKLFLDRLYPLTDQKHKPRFGEKKLVNVYTHAAPISIFFKFYMNYNTKALKAMGLIPFKTIISKSAFTPDSARKNEKQMKRSYEVGKLLG
ncbi:MAG TPA: flavodoxin family protein [Candidatus Nitrosocosmicus sp.]|nr:flavodoxin family protein [Candidatus Nitrosocosmicus sp.]